MSARLNMRRTALVRSCMQVRLRLHRLRRWLRANWPRLQGLAVKRPILASLAGVALVLLGLEFYLALRYTGISSSVLEQFEKYPIANLEDRKRAAETVALQIENQRRTLFWAALAANTSATVTVLLAFAGLWSAFRQYMDAQRKESEERKKEHFDRVSADLNQLWTGVTSKDVHKQAASVAGLQDLLSPDKEAFHRRVAAALALVGRWRPEGGLLEVTYIPVVEEALRRLDHQISASVSWQGLRLPGANLAGLDLHGFDFRDAWLEDANFEGANLNAARFHNARLNGANFRHAHLAGAVLNYADVAGADFSQADLRHADLSGVKILDANLDNADLNGSEASWTDVQLTHARNWRTAKMNDVTRLGLANRHGGSVQPPRVLMLLWEFLPDVSGGAWTAAYHLIRRLRLQGADLTILVPWKETPDARTVFGNEVTLVFANVRDRDAGLAHARTRRTQPVESATLEPSVYDGAYAYGVSQFDLVNRFTQKALEYIANKQPQFDVIHAHDWLTFPAAERISLVKQWPWIAHVHSIEADRRRVPHRTIAAVEARACQTATRLLTPSRYTATRLKQEYNAAKDKLVVAPNCLTAPRIAQGRIVDLDPGEVVFVGRHAWQKGPDLFIRIACAVFRQRPETCFVLYGDRARSADGTSPTQRLIERLANAERIPVLVDPAEDEQFDAVADNILKISAAPPPAADGAPGPTPSEPELKLSLLKRGFLAFLEPDEKGCVYRAYALGGENPWQFTIATSRPLSGPTWRPQIVTRPFVPWARRAEAFRHAAIAVVPSRHEPFGMVVLEAMEAGVPVFTAQTAGALEVLNTPLRIDPDNPKSCAEQIVALLRDQNRWQKQVDQQFEELTSFAASRGEQPIIRLWQQLAKRSASATIGAVGVGPAPADKPPAGQALPNR
jgi:glycosyltransferase involved in cell wall biosynthesis